MGQHLHELLHVAAATLFVVLGVSALLEYRNLRERVVLPLIIERNVRLYWDQGVTKCVEPLP